jgi:hypothetical protein
MKKENSKNNYFFMYGLNCCKYEFEPSFFCVIGSAGSGQGARAVSCKSSGSTKLIQLLVTTGPAPQHCYL